MKSLPYPIANNEGNIFKIYLLQQALTALGKKINDDELKKKIGESTKKAVADIKKELGISSTSELLIDSAASKSLTEYLQKTDFFDNVFSVSGKVMNADGDGVQAAVKIYDIGLKGMKDYGKAEKVSEWTPENGFTLVGETISSKKGQYATTFFYNVFVNGERKLPDLVAIATKGTGIVGWSRLVLEEEFDAEGIIDNLDINLAREKGAHATEFARITTLLGAFLEESNVKIAELYDSPQQVVFAARELSLNPAYVAYYIVAHKCCVELTQNEDYHELLYGLGRKGYKLFLPAFYNKKQTTLLSDIKTAIAEKIIADNSDDAINTFLAALLHKSREEAYDYKNGDQKPFQEYLSVLFEDTNKQKTYFKLIQNQEPGKNFEEELIKNDLKDDIPRLKLIQQLNLITGNNFKLAGKIATDIKLLKDLLSAKKAEWEKWVTESGIPADVPGNNENEKISNYAESILNTITALYPTEKIKLMLGNGQIFKTTDLNKKVEEYIEKKKIDIQKDFVKSFLQEKKDLSKLDETQKETLKLQRIYQVSNTAQAMQVLVEHNLDSAYKIAAIPRKTFIKTYSKEMGGEAIALATHERACFIKTRCAAAIREINEATHQPMPQLAKLTKSSASKWVSGTTNLSLANNAIERGNDAAEKQEKDESGYDYSALFGSPDICECEYCRSMYGASAYFVELMLLLKNSTTKGVAHNALTVLLNRRPDLQHLQLTCENSETEIPYIDLANEVMESYIYNAPKNDEKEKVKAFNNDEISKAELRLEPQNLEIEVYKKISTAKYPFTLPYHLPLDIIRAHSEQLGVSRFEVMQIMRLGQLAEDPWELVAESLELSLEEYGFLTDDGAGTGTLFGYADDVELKNLQQAREVLHRTGLKYTELVDLLKTRFINPGWPAFNFIQGLFKTSGIPAGVLFNAIKSLVKGDAVKNEVKEFLKKAEIDGIKWSEYFNDVMGIFNSSVIADEWAEYLRTNFENFNSIITPHHPKSACDLDETVLRTIEKVYLPNNVGESGIDVAQWKKVYQFIRLWRKLGWTMPELDHLLAALQIKEINTDALEKLAWAKQLQKLLKIDVHNLAVLWGDIDTNGDNSQFKKLFLNKTVLNTVKEEDQDAWKSYLDKGEANPLLKNNIPAIIVALGLSEEDWKILSGGFLDQWINVANDGGAVPFMQWRLTITILSTFLRIKILSTISGLSIPDLSRMMRCFTLPTSSFVRTIVSAYEVRPKESFELCSFLIQLKDLPLSLDELEYILQATMPATANFGLTDEKLLSACKSANESINAIEQAFPAASSIVVTPDVLSAVLLILCNNKKTELAKFIALLQSAYSFSSSINKDLTVNIDDNLKDLISYDKDTGLLTIKGMLKASEEEISAFSVDESYVKAIDEYSLELQKIKDCFEGNFFNNQIFEEGNQVWKPKQNIIPTTYDLAVQKVKEQLKKTVIIRTLSIITGLAEDIMKELITDSTIWISKILSIPPAWNADDDKDTIQKIIDKLTELRKEIIPLHRASILINKLKFTGTEVGFIKVNSVQFENLDFLSVKSKHLKVLLKLAELKKGFPETKATLIDVFKSGPADQQQKLSDATAWPVELIIALHNHFGFNSSSYKSIDDLLSLKKAVTLVKKMKIPVAAAIQWGKATGDFDELYQTAQLIRVSVKSLYSEKQWMELGAQLSDKVREHRRDALIAYLLTLGLKDIKGDTIRDADGLFQYFLLDVQMGKCMDTSRIVQASAAIQLFINRCLLGMESKKNDGNKEVGVSPDMINEVRWNWMQYYRVWEVNRKIFLYPENWLMPEWRTERSQFFKELESELTQNDITDRNVETAFRNYLTKMNEVANLEVCGMWEEKEDDNIDLKCIHVFARTRNAPHTVYYRKWEAGIDKWYAWEKVNVDIRHVDDGENSGVHLLPVVWNNRLFLFWPEFMEKSGSDENKNLVKNWEIRLAWTEYVDGKWLPKNLSTHYSIEKSHPSGSTLSSFDFQIGIAEDENIKIWICSPLLLMGYYGRLQNFTFWNHSVEVDSFDSRDGLLGIKNWSDFSLFFGKRKSDLQKEKSVSSSFLLKDKLDYLIAIALTENNLSVTTSGPDDRGDYTRNLNSINLLTKFFFLSSQNRTYFVKPITNTISKWKELDLNTSVLGFEFEGELVEKFDPEDIFGPGFKERTQGASNEFFEKANIVAQILGGPVSKTPLNIQPIASQVAHRATIITNTSQQSNSAATKASSNITTFLAAPLTQTGAPLQGGRLLQPYWTSVDGLQFNIFHHPYVGQMVTNLNKDGLTGLMGSDTLRKSDLNDGENNEIVYDDKGNSFKDIFYPNFAEGLVENKPTRFRENISFDSFNANSIYNWELFYHAPVYIALRLSKNGKYKEAMKWFHYIFNPTTDKMDVAKEEENSRYWEVLPFKTTVSESLREILIRYNSEEGEHEDVKEWRDKPFQPHIVAGKRPIAYMKYTVLKYVENLLDWGDSLFRQFTRETVNEALHLYVIANEILGKRPEFVPKRGHIKPETFASLEGKLDELGNAMVLAENIFPFSGNVSVTDTDSANPPSLLGYGEEFYFCIPNNEEMLKYWDRAADRLYKIRHCMDIDGVERRLALFAPPIDPAMLINAAAQGLSIGDILSSLGTPSPLYRFSYMLQKANEFCNDVKSIGSSLLSVLEKKDAEELSRLRSSQETAMLELMTQVKERQVLDAKLSKEGLLKSRETAALRLEYYQSLLSNENIKIPVLDEMDAELNESTQLPADTAIIKLKPDVNTELVDGGERGVKLIKMERQQLDDSYSALVSQGVATGMEALAGLMNYLPNISASVSIPLIGEASVSFGGSNIGSAISAYAKVPQIVSSIYSYYANRNGQMASYIRREQEWTLQANLAGREIIQIDKQITSADIKIQLSQKELSNHKKQIENNKNIEAYMKDKFTSQELYEWMKDQLVGVYKQSFDMAFDLAKKAELCYRNELGNDTANFIQYGHWDNIKHGLCAGEKLQLNLRQMEKAYIDNNRRQFEITQHFSMLQIAPEKLMQLKIDGQCTDFEIPEEVFDIMYPGYYRRIIKSVRISIPCIAGPHTNIGATLTLGNSKLRKKTNEDLIDVPYNGHRMIATSNAQNDGGQFELNFRDERYLPFEGAGAVSTWTLSLPEAVRPFDYNTIADVIFQISYTADYDGIYKESVETSLAEDLNEINGKGFERVFSMRYDFPKEWQLLNSTADAVDVSFKREHFPFWANTSNSKGIGKCYKLSREGRLLDGGATIAKIENGVKISGVEVGIQDIIFIVDYSTVAPTDSA